MNARISARARDDLDYIFACICARQGIEAGDRFLAIAKQAVAFLVQNPDAGPHPSGATKHSPAEPETRNPKAEGRKKSEIRNPKLIAFAQEIFSKMIDLQPLKYKTLRFWVISKTSFLVYYFADEYGVSIGAIEEHPSIPGDLKIQQNDVRRREFVAVPQLRENTGTTAAWLYGPTIYLHRLNLSEPVATVLRRTKRRGILAPVWRLSRDREL